MWSYNYSNELYHYGVKGMKWGVRRSPVQLGHDVRQKRLAKKMRRNSQELRCITEKEPETVGSL